MGGLVIFIPLILIMYFLMIRPQQRRVKEHQRLLAGVDVGDDVVTSAGIYGRVSDIDGDTLFLLVNDTVELKVTKESIAGLVSYDDDIEDEVEDEIEDEIDDELADGE